MPLLSVVTPVYGAVNIVDELYRQLVKNITKITDDFEIIMVNDACPHGSGAKIAALARKDARVKFVDLARNFGQHIAIAAGLDHAEGEYVVVMDCDLQDPPDKIGEMFEALKASGKEVIFAERIKRKEGFMKKFYSKAFCVIMRFLTDKVFCEQRDIANFSIITRNVVLELRKLREMYRNYNSLILWCGFEKAYIPIEMGARFEGASSYTFMKSLQHAFRILLQQSVKPLYISVVFSMLSFVASCVLGVFILYNHVSGNISVVGYASVMLSIFFVSTMIFFTLAVMSIYLANVFQEQRQRPLYVAARRMNLNSHISQDHRV